jgi:hypothetical protein
MYKVYGAERVHRILTRYYRRLLFCPFYFIIFIFGKVEMVGRASKEGRLLCSL